MDPTNPFDNLSAFGSLSPPPTDITPQQPAAPQPQQNYGDGFLNLVMGGAPPPGGYGGAVGFLSRLANGQSPQTPQASQPQTTQQAPQQAQQPLQQMRPMQFQQPNYGMLSQLLAHLQPAR